MGMKSISNELRHISTDCISDAFDMLGITGGITTGFIPISPGIRIAGPAVTLREVPARMGENLIRHGEVIETFAGPGDVIVQDADGRTDVNCFGGLMAQGAKNKGIEGAVVYGAIRDAQEIRESGFPIFTLGFSPVRSVGRFETICINEPVQLGSVQVKPKDIVVADDDGVAVIPETKVDEVLQLAKEKQDIIDDGIMKMLKRGELYSEETFRKSGVPLEKLYKWGFLKKK